MSSVVFVGFKCKGSPYNFSKMKCTKIVKQKQSNLFCEKFGTDTLLQHDTSLAYKHVENLLTEIPE